MNNDSLLLSLSKLVGSEKNWTPTSRAGQGSSTFGNILLIYVQMLIIAVQLPVINKRKSCTFHA